MGFDEAVLRAIAWAGGGILALWGLYMVAFSASSGWTSGKLQAEERFQKNIFQKALDKMKEKKQ